VQGAKAPGFPELVYRSSTEFTGHIQPSIPLIQPMNVLSDARASLKSAPPDYAEQQRLGRIVLLEEDPELGEALSGEDVGRATRTLIAAGVSVSPGYWRPPLERPDRAHLGYLLLGGVLLRELTVARSRSVEFLARGDLLRPWTELQPSFSAVAFRVTQRLRLAVLDGDFASRLLRWPSVADILLDRALRRSRWLAGSAAISGMRGVDRKVLMLFWHLGERWGELSPDGVVLPLTLTHEVIATMIGSRRPTVTAALHRLASTGQLTRSGAGWQIRGSPPLPGEDPEVWSQPGSLRRRSAKLLW
jgi:CRP-like cAMP-binding protein